MILRKVYDMTDPFDQKELGIDTHKLALARPKYEVRAKQKNGGEDLDIIVDVSCNLGSTQYDMANSLGFRRIRN